MNPCKKAWKEYQKKVNEAWEKIKKRHGLTEEEMIDIIYNDYREMGEVIDEWNEVVDKIQKEVEKKYEEYGIWIEHEGGHVRAYNGEYDTDEKVD